MPDLIDHNKALVRNWDSVIAVKECLREEELDTAILYWYEIPHDDQIALWVAPRKGGIFTTHERALMKSDEWGRIRREQIEQD